MNTKMIRTGKPVVATNSVNESGGAAYSMSDQESLAQLIVTGTLNDTFYTSSDTQLDSIKEYAAGCSNEFLAKAAVYARLNGKMKDTPVLLLAILANRSDRGNLLSKSFDKVINDTKSLRNFAQVIRSGVTGRKSFGTEAKRLMQRWLSSKTADQLFLGSIGNTPSLADVVKMVHPKPGNEDKNAFYAWLLGKEYKVENLSPKLAHFESFKKNPVGEVPQVDFRMLSSLTLTDTQWKNVALNASWNTLRMNLNNFAKHNVFDTKSVVEKLCEKLSNKENVKRSNVFPYQLLTTFQNIDSEVPNAIRLALQHAMEYAVNNVPDYGTDPIILVDTSGSMQSPVTGNRGSVTTKTTCVDVAALIGVSILRANPNGVLIPFDTKPHNHDINPLDSIMTNSTKLAKYGGGGTNISVGIALANQRELKSNLIVIVSDNESWVGTGRTLYGNSETATMTQWIIFKKRNPQAKLVCINLQPYATTQASGSKDILNLGGFSDETFSVISRFLESSGKENFVSVIEAVEL